MTNRGLVEFHGPVARGMVPSRSPDGLGGVGDQVHHHLLELGGIGLDGGQSGCEVGV